VTNNILLPQPDVYLCIVVCQLFRSGCLVLSQTSAWAQQPFWPLLLFSVAAIAISCTAFCAIATAGMANTERKEWGALFGDDASNSFPVSQRHLIHAAANARCCLLATFSLWLSFSTNSGVGPTTFLAAVTFLRCSNCNQLYSFLRNRNRRHRYHGTQRMGRGIWGRC
jgi:hypothetical protein